MAATSWESWRCDNCGKTNKYASDEPMIQFCERCGGDKLIVAHIWTDEEIQRASDAESERMRGVSGSTEGHKFMKRPGFGLW